MSPFVGFLTLWLIGIGLFSVKGKNRLLIAYFIGLGLLGLVMSMGADNPLYPFILERLPYIRAPGRFLLLWTFSLATLAGIFLDGLLKIISGSKERPEFKRPAYLATAFALAGIAFVFWLTNDEGILQSQLQTLATLTAAHPIVLRELLQRSLLIMAVTLVLIAGLFWAARISAVSATIWGWLAVAVLLVEMVLFARPLVQPNPLTRLVDPRDPFGDTKH